MASNSQRTERIRARKLKTRGAARKNALERNGTTPTRADLFKVVTE